MWVMSVKVRMCKVRSVSVRSVGDECEGKDV